MKKQERLKKTQWKSKTKKQKSNHVQPEPIQESLLEEGANKRSLESLSFGEWVSEPSFIWVADTL